SASSTESTTGSAETVQATTRQDAMATANVFMVEVVCSGRAASKCGKTCMKRAFHGEWAPRLVDSSHHRAITWWCEEARLGSCGGGGHRRSRMPVPQSRRALR